MFDITQSFYYLDAQTEEKRAEIQQQQQQENLLPKGGPAPLEEQTAPTDLPGIGEIHIWECFKT